MNYWYENAQAFYNFTRQRNKILGIKSRHVMRKGKKEKEKE